MARSGTGARWFCRTNEVVALVLLLSLGCSNDRPTGHARPPAGYSLRGDGIEVTGHLPLNSGATHRLVFSILDDAKRVVTDTANLQLSLIFEPADLATATPVAGTTTSFDVMTTKPADTDGFMTLSVYDTETQATRTFAPFPVLVH
jgi:hypothetical protein